MGELKLTQIERRHLERAQAELAKKYSPMTVNMMLGEVNTLLGRALNEKLIDQHPAVGMRKLKRLGRPARETIHRALTLGETEKFFRTAEEVRSWYLPLYVFLLNTGCRVGEAAALMPSDIYKEKDGIIRIRINKTITKGDSNAYIIGDTTKTESSKRNIYLNDAAKMALLEQRRINKEILDGNLVSMEEKPIFRSPYGCLVMSGQIHKDIKKICKQAEIEHFGVHAFRDTFATRALESGMSPKTLQEILGHARISMTMELYAHVMEETKKREMIAVVTRTDREA